MRDFQKFLEKNRRKMYEMAYANCKHDENGHCIFPENDPWMKDAAWDKERQENEPQEAKYVAAAN